MRTFVTGCRKASVMIYVLQGAAESAQSLASISAPLSNLLSLIARSRSLRIPWPPAGSLLIPPSLESHSYRPGGMCQLICLQHGYLLALRTSFWVTHTTAMQCTERHPSAAIKNYERYGEDSAYKRLTPPPFEIALSWTKSMDVVKYFQNCDGIWRFITLLTYAFRPSTYSHPES
jgi:hypothetical protein